MDDIIRSSKVAAVEVKMDPKIKPRQERPRRMAVHLKGKVKNYLENMMKKGVITKLQPNADHAGGLVSNLVITKKKWDSSEIRVNLDTMHMEEVIVKTKWVITTVEELRHEFTGMDRFCALDMNHAFLQFELMEDS